MTASTARFLVDTNLLIYQFDPKEILKSDRANQVIQRIAELQTGCISTQVLSEFFSAFTKKLGKYYSPEEAIERLRSQIEFWPILRLDEDVILEAARGSVRFQINFWDAQLWATAKMFGVPAILTEDLSHGQTLEGVTFLNPFHSGFQLEEWL